MSAPEDGTEKQARRHRAPLVGMAVVVLFGVLLIGYWILEEAERAGPPQGADVQVDGRTGEPEETSDSAAPGAANQDGN